MGYLLEKAKQIEAEIKETCELTAKELAMTKTTNEWEKLKDKSTNDNERIYYNALQRLRKSIDKKKQNDIVDWEFIVSQLREINNK